MIKQFPAYHLPFSFSTGRTFSGNQDELSLAGDFRPHSTGTGPVTTLLERFLRIFYQVIK